jgi:hypothetical protein
MTPTTTTIDPTRLPFGFHCPSTKASRKDTLMSPIPSELLNRKDFSSAEQEPVDQ